MKKKRNIQQVKEHDKSPPNQTKEEEIGSLPEKEFRIMIAKLIQNLENKMELQINSLETRIEKMQEKFNKDLQEIKKSQSMMNNSINEIKKPKYTRHRHRKILLNFGVGVISSCGNHLQKRKHSKTLRRDTLALHDLYRMAT